jgi:cellulose synthase A
LQESGQSRCFDMLKDIDDCIHVISCGYENKTQWGEEVMFSRSIIILSM